VFSGGTKLAMTASRGRRTAEATMSVGTICTRVTHTATPDETVRTAAARMNERGVGTLVVVSESRRPIGIVTDRDIAVRCVAAGLDPDEARVSAIMSDPVRSVNEYTPIDAALRKMAGLHVRRCPVVDHTGVLVGILAVDDVLDLLAEEMTAVGSVVGERSLH
jgi:CBS domain-containing protein